MTPNPSDPLDRLRQHQPPRPDPGFVDQLEQRIRRAATDQPSTDSLRSAGYRRRPWRTWLTCGTAAAAMVLVAVMLWSMSTVSFAAVQAQMQNARSVQFVSRLSIAGLPLPLAPAEARTWFDADQGVRTDVRLLDAPLMQAAAFWGQPAVVLDHLNRQVIEMDRHHRTEAWMMQLDPAVVFDRLRQRVEGRLTRLGTRRLGDQVHHGFELAGPAIGLPPEMQVELWVDPASKLPVSVTCRYWKNQRAIFEIIVEQIVWNEPIFPEVFSLPVPEPYTLADRFALPVPSEQAMIDLLEDIGKRSGGAYPLHSRANQTLMQMALQLHMHTAHVGTARPTDVLDQAQLATLNRALAGGLYSLRLLRRYGSVVYQGQHVTAEQPQAVLMRWPIDPQRWRVVFGDLTVRTLTRQQVEQLGKHPSGSHQPDRQG